MATTKATMAMENSQHSIYVPAPIPTPPSNTNHRVVAFTAPQNYAARLSHLLHVNRRQPLWCPTVVVETNENTKSAIQFHLSNPNAARNGSSLKHFSAIAFTSRTGISAFCEALSDVDEPPLAPSGEIFTISALGRDAELLDKGFVNRICKNAHRINVLVPPIATPASQVESLGFGRGRRVLCPVPMVVGLEEPPVVPDLLHGLASKGWVPVRVNAYHTRWLGPECAEAVVRMSEEGEGLDAIVFTSTAEVEGLLKSLKEYGLDWGMVKRRLPGLVAAAHGPVTAAGAERLGVGVDVVSSRFDSFDGVVEALAFRL